MKPDDELKKLLLRWEAPAASQELDRRVRESFVRSRGTVVSWKLWGAVAAGVAFAVAAFTSGRSAPVPASGANPRVETRLTRAGFRPIREGAVTVVRAGATR